ncbi:MAG: phosphoadenylyl-sulfate reductase [Pseudomonadota bacterium]
MPRGFPPQHILALAQDGFAGRMAFVSSFGAESAALLHMVAETDPSMPLLFLETGMLFAETLSYQRDLAAHLGLRDVRPVQPGPGVMARETASGALHRRDPDACCSLRKTLPLQKALDPFSAWITGRKRYQAASRAGLAVFEADDAGRPKLNPLTGWDAAHIRACSAAHELPPHPLVARGYPSIGCAPCTTPVAPGEDPRAGRWRGQTKTECGIHFENGRAVRSVRLGRSGRSGRSGQDGVNAGCP